MYKTIELMKRANVGRETVRYYESRGLIKPVARTPGGYKLYDEETIDKLRFIKNAQKLDFTLNEIADLYTLLIKSKNPWNELTSIIENRLKNINRQKSNLEKIRKIVDKYRKDWDYKKKSKELNSIVIKQFSKMGFEL